MRSLEPFRAVVPVAVLPVELVRLCGPFEAIVSCGRQGESGALEPWPVCVPGVVVGDVLEPRCCVCVVLPPAPVLCAIAGTASATASAAPPVAVISVFFICSPWVLLIGPRVELQRGRRE